MAKKGETTSEETRAKMSAAHEKRWRSKRNIYLQVCVYSVHQGAKRSKLTRKLMSESHKGHQHSPETIEKIREALSKK